MLTTNVRPLRTIKGLRPIQSASSPANRVEITLPSSTAATIIALSHGYGPLFFGRLLQGVSGGFIGVVVPLYLAECLSAATRGKGTGVFQWLLTLGIVAAALIGIYFSYRVADVTASTNAATLFAFKDQA